MYLSKSSNKLRAAVGTGKPRAENSKQGLTTTTSLRKGLPPWQPYVTDLKSSLLSIMAERGSNAEASKPLETRISCTAAGRRQQSTGSKGPEEQQQQQMVLEQQETHLWAEGIKGWHDNAVKGGAVRPGSGSRWERDVDGVILALASPHLVHVSGCPGKQQVELSMKQAVPKMFG